MAFIGFAVAGYLLYKKESKLLWIPIAYFGVMELLQALTYFTMGACTPANQILTFLSYVHISFQPFFINALMLYFIPERFRKNIYSWVFGLAFVATVLLLLRMYPFEWAGMCNLGDGLCGDKLCAVEGNFHLAWEIPFNGIGGIIGWAYALSVFVIPLLYGSWKATTYNFLVGPVLAMSLTDNPNEWPAVWCLMSIAIILVILIPWARRKMHVRKWYFWEYPHKCLRCKHWWEPDDGDKHPLKCPRCKSPYWHTKPTKKKKKK
jgi:hypothetical protein